MGCSGAAWMAGSESCWLGLAPLPRSSPLCQRRCSVLAESPLSCHKMLGKECRDGKNNSWEISLSNQGEGQKLASREGCFSRKGVFSKLRLPARKQELRTCGGVEEGPGFIAEGAAFQQRVKRLLQPRRLGGGASQPEQCAHPGWVTASPARLSEPSRLGTGAGP